MFSLLSLEHPPPQIFALCAQGINSHLQILLLRSLMTHQTSPGLNHKAICSLYVILLIMIRSMKMRWQAELAQLTILKVLSSYSMKSLFPIFGNSGREAKDLSSESILFQILSTKWQSVLWELSFHQEKFYNAGKREAEGTEKETQRYHHMDILQITLFSPLQLWVTETRWRNGRMRCISGHY